MKFKDIVNSVPSKDYQGITIVNTLGCILNWPQSIFSMIEEEMLTSHVNDNWALIETDIANYSIQSVLKAAAFLGSFDGKKVLFIANHKTADIFTKKTGIEANTFIGTDLNHNTGNNYELVITCNQSYPYTGTYPMYSNADAASIYSKKISNNSLDAAAAVIISYYVNTILLGLFNRLNFSSSAKVTREEGIPHLLEAASSGLFTGIEQKKLYIGGIEEHITSLAYQQVCSRNDETATQIKQIETLIQLWDIILGNSDQKIVEEIYKETLSPTDKIKKLASHFNIDLMLETVLAGVPIQDVVSDLK